MAIRNAFALHFPDVTQKGCYFHYGQVSFYAILFYIIVIIVIILVTYYNSIKALWRRVVQGGMKTTYSQKGHAAFAGFFRAAMGLPYVPEARMTEAVNVLKRIGSSLGEEYKDFVT